MFPLSIRLRLTLWCTAILAIILALFATGVYLTMRETLRDQLDDTLLNRASLVQGAITFSADGTPQLDPATPIEELDPEDGFQRLFDASGRLLLDSSAGFGDVPVDNPAFERALSGRTVVRTAHGSGREARVVLVPVRNGADVVGVLEVAGSTADLREALRQLLLIFAVALPAAIALAALGGWWLSSRALRPIDQITRTAKEIADQRDLSRRINLGEANDEVGRLAQTFDDMIAQLDAAFARQRQFTADASHELRTPLTAIRGQIDVALERERDPAEYQRVLGAVHAQVERMTRLVGGLLILARSGSSVRPLQFTRVDVAELVQSVADQMRPLAEAEGLTLAVAGEGALVVQGDEDLLLQLVLNLVENAIKYTERGVITIGWRTGTAPEIFVRDTGPGIAEEHRERIFERFYRVAPARSQEEGGVGLGLAICRWIAEAHSGSLSVESGPGGSTFTLELPAQ